MSVKDLNEFSRSIASILDFKEQAVPEWFNVEETKDGYFVAVLQKGKWLSDLQFKGMCTLMRDLKGDYVKGAKTFRVPGPCAKSESQSGHGMDSEAAYKEPGNEIDKGKSSALPMTMRPGFYEHFPVSSILSPSFTLRLNIVSSIKELEEQIATTTAGGEPCVILEPLVCRPASRLGYVEVAAGERRLLAAKELGLGVVPIVVKNLSDEEFDRVRMMENLARKDMTDYEVARALKYLMDKYPQVYPTQANLAEVFNKSHQWVTQHLQMLEPELANIVTRVTLESGKVTEHQAREILAAPEEKRQEIIDRMNETGEVPPVREIHEIAHPSEAPIERRQRLPPGKSSGVLCHRCGEIARNPTHLKGAFYCMDCAEQVELEQRKGPFSEEPSKESGVEEPPEETKATSSTAEYHTPPVHEPKAPAIQIGSFDCTECGKHFLVDHLPDGTHKLREVREAEA